MTARLPRQQTLALLALAGGALGIATAGIFVRLSETGPVATAFWRGALALPLLALWSLAGAVRARGCRAAAGPPAPAATPAPPRSASRSRDWRFLWAGLFFAGDLGLWHWSLLLTSVAASTLEANLAPIVVTLIAWLLWRERPRVGFLVALALALAGVLAMVSPKLRAGGGALLGDLLGLATACCYAGYIVVVARLRRSHATAVVMLRTTLVFTLVLLPIALGEKFVPDTLHGWAILVGLAVIAQTVGQGLIAYAFAHLPATLGSVGLYVQPVASAIYARLLLGERLTPVQLVGACVVLVAIALARASQPRDS